MPDAAIETSSSSCAMRLSLRDDREISNWQTVLDGVMGGRSTGNRFAQDGHMVFKGTINTNGGGFSSIRRSMPRGVMGGADALKLRVKQDGRAYRLTFRTEARLRGRRISYQLNIPQTPKGEWAEVTLPLKDFRTSIFGYDVTAPPFRAQDVREMGIILADGIDGPFQLGLSEIGCVSA
jgi:hypothetical protein